MVVIETGQFHLFHFRQPLKWRERDTKRKEEKICIYINYGKLFRSKFIFNRLLDFGFVSICIHNFVQLNFFSVFFFCSSLQQQHCYCCCYGRYYAVERFFFFFFWLLLLYCRRCCRFAIAVAVVVAVVVIVVIIVCRSLRCKTFL